jgi:hypothetical protein
MIDGNFTKFFIRPTVYDRRLYKITVYCEGVVQRSTKKRPVHDNPENIEMRNAICEIERVY